MRIVMLFICFFFLQAEDGIRDADVTGVQTCALPISVSSQMWPSVAPASSVGTTGTPGHICELTASTGPTISRESGGGGESVGSCVGVILILPFAMTRARVF